MACCPSLIVNSLNTDQALHFVRPDLDSNNLHELSADNWQTKS